MPKAATSNFGFCNDDFVIIERLRTDIVKLLFISLFGNISAVSVVINSEVVVMRAVANMFGNITAVLGVINNVLIALAADILVS